MALMADDVVLMPNEAVLKGKPAVRAWYDRLVAQLRTASLTITDREVLIGGDWATELAAFEWSSCRSPAARRSSIRKLRAGMAP
jgi:ketosteroid isomerase-like protein